MVVPCNLHGVMLVHSSGTRTRVCVGGIGSGPVVPKSYHMRARGTSLSLAAACSDIPALAQRRRHSCERTNKINTIPAIYVHS